MEIEETKTKQISKNPLKKIQKKLPEDSMIRVTNLVVDITVDNVNGISNNCKIFCLDMMEKNLEILSIQNFR